eukprot:Sdes_comp18356_c0_seq1m8124
MAVMIESNSLVENYFLKQSERSLSYPPAEKIGVIEVENFPLLGKLTALRFLEWVQQNAGGVISLPTGKTPEHFIHWVTHYLKTWECVDTQTELAAFGVDASVKPDMKSLHFVQIDEFYPMNPVQHNSFLDYVQKYYIHGFGLDPHKALLIDTWTLGCPAGMNAGEIFPETESIDLSLRLRVARNPKEELQKSVLRAVDQFCTQYETKIRALGGIGFFLGGIGPDGHIAFNIAGSDHHSTTRLMSTNYETQAAAATDLGGIQVAQRGLVITIGLATIAFREDVVALVMAAGEAKARKVAESITCSVCNDLPATCLHGMRNARFFITQGAAKLLEQRNLLDMREKAAKKQLSWLDVEMAVINLSLRLSKKIVALTLHDFSQDAFCQHVLTGYGLGSSGEKVKQLCGEIEKKLIQKLENGSREVLQTKIMHTAPHHDDIMLGYLPYAIHLVRPESNQHTFNYCTSGFNAVTNQYVMERLGLVVDRLGDAKSEFHEKFRQGYFARANRVGYLTDVHVYLDGVASRSESLKECGEAYRMCRILADLFECRSGEQTLQKAQESIQYFKSLYPGQKDTPIYQKMKGMIREFEADILWGYFGFSDKVNHLRLGFYKGDYFTEEPEVNRDVLPILKILQDTQPNVVSVAFDPEGSGPDTHYKVLQAVCEALRIHVRDSVKSGGDRSEVIKKMRVWGYRNVWFRFHPAEAELFVPVSLNSMAIMEDAFHNSFGSQRKAEFPAPEYDGPFNRYSQQIQAQQLQQMKICLGSDFFESHSSPRIRAAHGLNFLRDMPLESFFQAARALKKSAENE